MSIKKTIQINPELFKISGQKTKKNREKRDLQINPIINPNNLKNKLLKRIKEHKTKELKQDYLSTNNSSRSNEKTDNNFSDEFYSAVNYLSDLSKKQKQQTILHNKTVKNNSSIAPFPNVSLELPPELEEPIKSNIFVPQTTEVFNVNYKSGEDVPYGCLKNGKKKTYREWKELSRVNEIPSLVRPPTPPKKNVGVFLEGAVPIIAPTPINTLSSNTLSRDQRLEQIKNKLKKLQDEETQNKMKVIDDLKKIETDMNSKLKSNGESQFLDELPEIDENQNLLPDISELIKTREEKIEKETPKQYLKKTVKRKFTLGKSDKLKKVAVLIKDKKTRKNIINTQKELKKINITDVRKYLRQHGIIKVGSTCPPDILRKTFESALMAGEITNVNKETLLHNFLNEEKI
jgi:hypothetical protein